MKPTTDMVCALALAVGLLACIFIGDNANVGTIVGALAGYMGRAALNKG